MDNPIRPLLNRIEDDLRTLSEVLETSGIKVYKIEAHLRRRYVPFDKVLFMIWDNISWISSEDTMWISADSLLKMLESRKILFRKF